MPVMFQFSLFVFHQFTLFRFRQKQRHPVAVSLIKAESEDGLRGVLWPVPGIRPDHAPEDGGFAAFQ